MQGFKSLLEGLWLLYHRKNTKNYWKISGGFSSIAKSYKALQKFHKTVTKTMSISHTFTFYSSALRRYGTVDLFVSYRSVNVLFSIVGNKK